MKRRNFIKSTLPLGIAPFFLNGMAVKSMATSLMADSFTCEQVGERVMVIIQMHGGNDGANMVIPVEQHADYMNIRPNIGMSYTNADILDSTLPTADQVVLHPQMTPLRQLYDQGMVNVIQGVTYDNNNKSHFKGGNIWLTGGDSTAAGQDLRSGWFGRYLNHTYPNYPFDYPNPIMEDPIGLEFGSKTISLGFHREVGVPIGLALSNDPTDFYNMVAGIGGAYPTNVPISRYGSEMQYLIDIQKSSDSYSTRLNTCYNAGTNDAAVMYPDTYPGTTSCHNWNELTPQLKTVARLISGGCKTKVYLVRIGGFDTHVNQVDSTDNTLGCHGTLLHNFSAAVKAFHDDLEAQGLAERVMTVTFSEFGRQAGENGNSGTDHGTLAPMFVFGRGVTPGITGTNPDWSNIVNNNFTSYQHDYRQVFTTLLQDWLGASDNALATSQFSAFQSQKLDLVNSNYVDPLGNELNFVVEPVCLNESAFPIGLKYFDAIVEDNSVVRLNWATATETNNDYFNIERSIDGVLFESIIKTPGAGNSNTEISYSTLDESPLPGESFYRLKQTDHDGTYTYHNIVRVRIENLESPRVAVKAFPNPATDRLTFTISSAEVLPVSVYFYTAGGAKIKELSMNLQAGLSRKEINVQNFSPGLYYIEVVANSNNGFEYRQLARFKQIIK